MTEHRATDFLEFFTDMADRAKELVAREEAFQALADDLKDRTFDELKTIASSLTGEQKVALVKAMGFSPRGSDHQDDCIRYTHGAGFRCNCVPPATEWSQPHDVAAFRKETWKDRLALAHQWSREGSHGREKEEDE